MSRHLWLAIDPGIATGWALMSDDGALEATSVWGTADLQVSLDALIRTVYSSGRSLTVIIEKMPSAGGTGELAAKLEAVRATILLLVHETYEIPYILVQPGEWKPSRVAKTTKVPASFRGSALVVHQRDAVRMGRYVIDAKQRQVQRASA